LALCGRGVIEEEHMNWLVRNKHLWWLFAVLAAIGAVLIYVMPSSSLSGIAANLFTEVSGILITLTLVDKLLEDHEEQRWSTVDAQVQARVRLLGTSGITAIRSALRVPYQSLLPERTAFEQLHRLEAAYMDAVESRLEPQVRTLSVGLKSKDWNELMEKVREIGVECERTMLLFGHRLPPDTQAELLAIQSACRTLYLPYEAVPEYFGEVPEGASEEEDGRHLAMVSQAGDRLQSLIVQLRTLVRAHQADGAA
jgi:hypothetical protein